MTAKEYTKYLAQCALNCGWQKKTDARALWWASGLVAREVCRFRFGKVVDDVELGGFSDSEVEAHAWALLSTAEYCTDVLRGAQKVSASKRRFNLYPAVYAVSERLLRERVQAELREKTIGKVPTWKRLKLQAVRWHLLLRSDVSASNSSPGPAKQIAEPVNKPK